jgi:trans-2,3-dihydro-3-hydroxyanthranilate isomerase
VHDEALSRVNVDLAQLAALPGAGVYVFSFDDTSAHARSFAAGVGVPEDPATGSAALGLGVYLAATGLIIDEANVEVRQGIEMGRPSLLSLSIDVADRAATRVRVAGAVHPISNGTITPP